MQLNILFLTLDDRMVLEFIGYSLEQSLSDTSIGIFEASREHTALEILEQNTIHLIIADMNIRSIESYEFYDKLSLEVEYSHIPFVFLSSNEDDYDIAILKGISNFFLKPLDVDLLLKTLHKILQNTTQLPPQNEYLISDFDYIYPEKNEKNGLYFDQRESIIAILEYANKIENIFKQQPQCSSLKEDSIRDINKKIQKETEILLLNNGFNPR